MLTWAAHFFTDRFAQAIIFCSPYLRVQEKVGLKQSLAASQQTHRSNQKQLEQEVIRSKQEVASLELELANAQKVLK